MSIRDSKQKKITAFTLLFLALSLCFSVSTWAYTFTSGTWNGESIEYIEGDVFIKKASTASEADAADLLKKYDISIEGDFFLTDWAFAKSKDPNVDILKVIIKLEGESEIDIAEPNLKYEICWSADDPYYTDGTQWHLNNYGQNGGTSGADINVEDAWQYTRGGCNSYFSDFPIKIGIIDTGIQYDNDPSHPELNDIWRVTTGTNSTNEPGYNDLNGHGTYIAGIIAAEANNSLGIAGVAPSSDICVSKAFDQNGIGTQRTITNAILYNLNYSEVDIINCSFETSSRTDLWDDILATYENSILFVASSGNSNTNVSWPARYAYYYFNMIAVGATNRNNQRSFSSNYGPALICVAPGDEIYSTLPTNSYGYGIGSSTSSAAAIVSGVAALVKSVNHNLTPRQVRAAISSTATDLGSPGHDQYFGHGIVNATAAVEEAIEPISGTLNHPNLYTYWSTSIIIDGDVTIPSGQHLIIDKGVHVKSRMNTSQGPTINVYGELVIHSDAEDDYVVFEKHEDCLSSGPGIILYPGCSSSSRIRYCTFNSVVQTDLAPTSILLYGTSYSNKVELNYPIEYCTFNIPQGNGITAQHAIFEIDNNSFASTEELVVGVALSHTQTGTRIRNNTLIGKFDCGIYASNSRAVIYNNYIENTYHSTTCYTYGINLYNTPDRVRLNTIKYFNDGISTNSDLIMADNKITDCYNYGMYLVNCQPDMTWGLTGIGYNWLKDNNDQIYVTNNIYPYMTNGNNNIWDSPTGHAIASPSAPTVSTDLSGNYWGTTSPVPQVLFYPYSSNIDIFPYNYHTNSPVGGYRTASSESESGNFASGLSKLMDENYEEAAEIFLDVLVNGTNTSNRIGSVKRLVNCWNDIGELNESSIIILENCLESVNDVNLHEAIEGGIAYANTLLSNYSLALDYYESVIVDPSSSELQKLLSTIDAKYVYMETALNNRSSENKNYSRTEQLSIPLLGTIVELKPESVEDFENDVRRLNIEIRKLIRETDQEEIAEEILPTEFAITSAYPNPFNPSITIAYSLPERSDVSMKVYDVLGKEVTTLMNGTKNAGNHTITWNATEKGLNVASGVYFIHFQTPDSNITKKVVLMK